MKDVCWNLFKETGEVKYYLMYLKIKGDDSYENRDGRRDNT